MSKRVELYDIFTQTKDMFKRGEIELTNEMTEGKSMIIRWPIK